MFGYCDNLGQSISATSIFASLFMSQLGASHYLCGIARRHGSCWSSVMNFVCNEDIELSMDMKWYGTLYGRSLGLLKLGDGFDWGRLSKSSFSSFYFLLFYYLKISPLAMMGLCLWCDLTMSEILKNNYFSQTLYIHAFNCVMQGFLLCPCFIDTEFAANEL